MVIIGADLHKRSHTLVAVDGTGRKLAEKTAPATPAGHLELLSWATRFPERRFALEDCRHLSRRLEGDLVRAGEAVVRVPPKLMAGARRSSREPGVDHRDDLVKERTAIENRLRWHLHELSPGVEPAGRALDRVHVLAALDADLAGRQGIVARIARELVVAIRELTRRITALEREIDGLVRLLAPLTLALQGCGSLGAAKAIGEAAGMLRFRSCAAFARHNGSAPIPVWSGNSDRHRLNRGGNRQLNLVLHRIAITQVRLGGQGREYFDHRLANGDTRREALRALKRRISDELFRRLRTDEATRAASVAALPAAA